MSARNWQSAVVPNGRQRMPGPLRRLPAIDLQDAQLSSNRSVSHFGCRSDSPCGASWNAGSSATGCGCPERLLNTATHRAIPAQADGLAFLSQLLTDFFQTHQA
jgi:hypothetical protein